jgi:hypothetical protein
MNYPGNTTPQNGDDIELTVKKILLALVVYLGGGGGGSIGGISIKSPSASLTISDTAAHTGTWTSIQIVSAAVFTLLTGTNTGYATISYPAGLTLYGNFTAITLASGTVVANSP